MNTIEFLNSLRCLDIHISVEGDQLRCKAPKGVLTATLQSELSERKPEILDFLKGARATKTETESAITPVPRDNLLPLSFAQQRVWFLQQLSPESTAYHITYKIKLTGDLDVPALEQSLATILVRHESLRTRFVTTSGIPYQLVIPPTPFNLACIDLSLKPTSQQEAQLQVLLQKESRKPFDLTADTMLRTTLVRLQEGEHVLQVVLHHIAADGQSIGILMQELSTLYNAYTNGQPNSLKALSIQYPDFAVWQRSCLQGETLDRFLNYWRETLQGVTPLEFPNDRPRSTVQTYRGQQHSLWLSPSLTQSLKTLGQASGVTLFMVLLAALKLLLARLTGQEDIVVGAPVAGRDRVETSDLIGFFINTVVLRSNIKGNLRFSHLLAQVQQVTLEALAYQDLPFEKIVEELQPDRDLSCNPLFQVWVNMVNLDSESLQLTGLTAEKYRSSQSFANPSSKFDLTFYIKPSRKGLHFKLVSNADLFSAARMEELLCQYEFLLQQIVTQPDLPIWHYSLVTLNAQQLLPDPKMVLAEPLQIPVPVLIREWSEQQPKQIAICQGEQSWTYQQLLCKAEAIAHALQQQGVQPGTIIAVTGDRSFGLIASLVGVLMAGGVLLTIAPILPTARQQAMLTVAQAKWLIFVDGKQNKLNDFEAELPVLKIDPDTADLIEQQFESFPQASDRLPELSPNQAAYLFFTSGTTGTPKGVLGVHKGLAHFLTWQRETFSITPRDRVAQLTGLSFDVVLRDIFLPLSSGATLCLPTPENEASPTRILAWLERQKISVLHLVPTLAKTWLLNAPENVSLADLRWIFFAGEPLTESLIRKWRETWSNASSIVNLYGPTETTLAKCFHVIDGLPQAGIQPVGKPLPSTQALVLNRERQLCGIGEIGEITLRTPFRTLGYINSLEKQKQHFIENPFLQNEQDLVYCTGDLGRYRLDGSLEILGRQDHQVKIRGIRIEPGEIEAALVKHPAVQQCVVVAREDKAGDQQLVAYVVANTDEFPAPGIFRKALKQDLPSYMIPSAFVRLDSLPLTPNGKFDQTALPEPYSERLEKAPTIAEPQDELEQKLIHLFQATLQVENVSINDDFFDLGGHSLMAVQLFAKIEVLFGKALPLATLFQATTVAELAALIRQENWLAPWHSLVPIQPNGSKPPIFYIHAGGANLLIYRDLALSLGDDQPVYGLQPRGLDGHFDPFHTIEDMADHYLTQIRQIQPNGPYHLAGLSTGGTISWEIAQRLHQADEKVGLLALFDTSGPQYPKLMPLVPRLFSVLSWTLLNLVERIAAVPSKAAELLSEGGAEAVVEKVLVRLRLKQETLTPDEKAQRLVVERQFTSKLQKYNIQSGTSIEKIINLLIVWLLRRSTQSFYANLFASGIVRSPKRSLPEGLQTVQQATKQARKRYCPQPYPGKVIYFRASKRPPGICRDPLVGWEGMAKGGFEVFEIPGSHTDIVKSPKLAKVLKLCLRQAQSNPDETYC